MVRLSQIVAVTGLINGFGSAGFFGHKKNDCDRLKLKLTPYDDSSCRGVKQRKTQTMKQGHCSNFDDFQSATFEIVGDNKGPDLSQRNCSVYFYDHRDCKGHTLGSPDFRSLKGMAVNNVQHTVCGNVFDHTGPAPFLQAQSAIWYCIPKDIPAPACEPIHSTPSIPNQKLPMHCTLAKPAPLSRPVITATVVQTTTVLMPPIATVSGTTTIFVPKVRKMRTLVNTVTTTFFEEEVPSNIALSASADPSITAQINVRQHKRDNASKDRAQHASKAAKKDNKATKNRGPMGQCFGYTDDENTVTDCEQVVKPPKDAKPHLDAWDGQA